MDSALHWEQVMVGQEQGRELQGYSWVTLVPAGAAGRLGGWAARRGWPRAGRFGGWMSSRAGRC